MSNIVLEKLQNITDISNILIDEPMSKHTTFRVGGKADYFVIPKSKEEAADIVRLLSSIEIPYMVIGNGSNLLVSDSGFRGVIVCISKGMDDIIVDDCRIVAGAGAMLSKVSKQALVYGLTGLEFASGIPGSVGGGVVMNAGAYGGEMKDVISSVELLDVASGEVITFTTEQMQFAYRTSIAKTGNYIVLSATFALKRGDALAIKEVMDDLSNKRRDKQPLEYPSAGSTFKRPEGYFAAKLIDDAGLRGYSVGGAKVSDKHCGFVINESGATATDILQLMRDVKKKVLSEFEVELEPEVCMVGEDMSL